MKVATITFNPNCEDDRKLTLRSMIPKERVKEVLTSWLETQRGRGEDDTPVEDRDEYQVNIEQLDYSLPVFTVSSEIPNKDMIGGIILMALNKWDTISE